MGPLPETVLVWGAGGHGRVVGDLVRAVGFQLFGYADADSGKLGEPVGTLGVTVTHSEDQLISEVLRNARFPEGIDACALGVGENRARQRCLNALIGLELPALIHPSATISPTARVGRGTVVFPHAVVHSGAWVGDGVIVNTGSIVEHDCVLASAVHVSPGAVLCGGVRVGERSWIGAGSTVIPGVSIGSDATVGAGSTVIRDVADEDIVVGSPAKGRKTG
jgi:sugar O-acyltransferase (sialic acid O-acetyltransferase NeuD family)